MISHLHFQKTWRPYQQRVLEELESHLGDGKLHVVASPGAGKTTLGIEVFRRLGQPALILSPTRSIRDQWVDRLRDFLPPDQPFPPEGVSVDLREPGVFTSITYQALHSWHREDAAAESCEDEGEEDEEGGETESLRKDEIQRLSRQIASRGIRTLILDEAHHLRQEWWTALAAVLDEVPDITTVSLTATPPFDVTGAEWRRYVELCGAIDTEISVPELVKAGTLCPHQDLVWLVKPREKARLLLRRQEERVDVLIERLRNEGALRDAVRAHPWSGTEDPPVEEVLEQPELAVALLVFMRETGDPLPPGLMRALELSAKELPAMDRRWWQVLLHGFLFEKRWISSTPDSPLRIRLTKELRAAELLSRRELRIDGLKSQQRQLSLCPSKLDAILDIHHAETRVRTDSLRQVVLVDFIRDEGFAAGAEPPETLGAWPAFFHLADSTLPETQSHCALITGRLMILHRERLDALRALCPEAAVSARDIPCLPAFVQIVSPGKARVAEFTRLLIAGEIRVLVGTRALLGEGWDAPVINSLILGTAVGSFMLTNQMRGRAIRVDPAHPEKCASIWHVATVEPRSPSGMDDVWELQRKFGTFVGLDAHKAEIANGISRMRLRYVEDDRVHPSHLHPDRNNLEMRERLGALEKWRERWRTAVLGGESERIAPGICAEEPPKFRAMVFTATLKRLILQLLNAWILYTLQFSHSLPRTDRIGNVLIMLLILMLVSFLYLLPKTLKLIWLSLRHLPVDGSVRQIALALRDALCECDLLKGPPQRFPVRSQPLTDGAHFLHLQQGDFQEQSLFADCLAEVLGPVENPRYVVAREGRNWAGVRLRDLHAVPSILAQNKSRAEVFLKYWRKRIGESDLHYTRTPEGRRDLVRARARTFATAVTPKAKRVDRWV
ncbi:MAG: DEAD/DEAH box helicase family protein [Verrucomicrobia bacterium]|nr:DEAD/DEAH box helicase family protein [Verrucomicrobiota bacterium]MCH8528013.1 DEAD/DEAH box helicase family protein [Kiritimatiellia bacterium]